MSFWEQFKQSTILQAVLALLWSGAVIAYVFLGLIVYGDRTADVPPVLLAPMAITLGWYFGRKDAQQTQLLIEKVMQILMRKFSGDDIASAPLHSAGRTLRQPGSPRQ